MNLRTIPSAVFITVATAALIGCSSTRPAAVPPGADDPNVVAVIDQEPLTLSEFEEHYARTAGGIDSARDDSMAAYTDFLDRYVNFRLKVRAARDSGLDRDPEVLNEIETYRANLARPYLIDREVLDPLVRQIYDRRMELLDVSHILVRLPEEATPADTLAAYQRLAAILDSARSGVDFGELAQRHSEDPSAGRPGVGYQGRLGYFTSGRMIREFEDVAYETGTGEISPIFRTSFGYHILRVEDRRENMPARSVAHIMVVPASDSADAHAAAMDTIKVVQARLAAGEPFEVLAQEYSADQRSAAQGGRLPAISYQSRLPESFIEAVYSLETVGDVSNIVETSYGLHLVKLLDLGTTPTYEEAYEELKREVSRLPRAARAEEDFARGLWENYDGSVDTAGVLRAVQPFELDSLLTWTANESLPAAFDSTEIAHLGDSAYTMVDFLKFAQDRGIPQDVDRGSGIRETLTYFARDAAIAYETAALEKRNPEFARVMSEFRDGLILFSLMEDSVWTAAAEDSLALRAHFDARREQYRFPERTRIVAFYSASDSLLSELAERIEDGVSGSDLSGILAADSTIASRIDTVRIAEKTNSVFDQALSLDVGGQVGPIQHNREWVLLLNDGTEPPRQKTFDEARATVVSEYQDELEAKLVQRLRDRYDVYVYPERLTAAYATPESASGRASATN